jgi:hypothetical protein
MHRANVPGLKSPVARADSQVTDTVDAALAPSAEQWTAQGPYRAAVSCGGWAARPMTADKRDFIREAPWSTSVGTDLTPVVAVLLGVLFVDERLSWNLIVGTAMVLLGVWIAERNLGSREREASDNSALLGDDAAQSQERIR